MAHFIKRHYTRSWASYIHI